MSEESKRPRGNQPGSKRGPYNLNSNTGHRGISKLGPGKYEGMFRANISWRTTDGESFSILVGRYRTLEEAVKARRTFIDGLY